MSSLVGKNTTLTVFAMTGALLLSACGGGEGTPRPEDTGGAGGTGGTTGGSGGSAAGTGGSGGSAGAPVEECPTPTPWTGGPISAVEMDGDRLETNKGGWFFFHAGETDGCPTCMTTPAPGEPPTVVLEEPDPERSGSTKALHWFGSGWVEAATYGAGMGIYFDNCASVPPEVTGISFHYISDMTLTFGSTQSSVDYGTDLPAATDWTLAEIDFSDLVPASGTAAFNQEKIGGVFWRVGEPASGSFDVWLDDVAWIGGM
jgi:hypothetical protein